jgi:uncharacterized coiled-coil DUF342 family protein
MIETKRLLIKSIQQVCDDSTGYFESQKTKIEHEYQTLLTKWEGLQNWRNNGPMLIERINGEIEQLEAQAKATENKQQINKLAEQLKELAAAGIDVSALLNGG